MDLGNRILQRRKEMGMTQAELAEKMFVTRQTISRWESGVAYPDVQKIVELAKLLQPWHFGKTSEEIGTTASR